MKIILNIFWNGLSMVQGCKMYCENCKIVFAKNTISQHKLISSPFSIPQGQRLTRLTSLSDIPRLLFLLFRVERDLLCVVESSSIKALKLEFSSLSSCCNCSTRSVNRSANSNFCSSVINSFAHGLKTSISLFQFKIMIYIQVKAYLRSEEFRLKFYRKSFTLRRFWLCLFPRQDFKWNP